MDGMMKNQKENRREREREIHKKDFCQSHQLDGARHGLDVTKDTRQS